MIDDHWGTVTPVVSLPQVSVIVFDWWGSMLGQLRVICPGRSYVTVPPPDAATPR